MMAMDEKTEALKFMRLIAEGYFSAAIDDRFVRVENPKFREDNGEDPYLIFDTAPENCPICDKPFKPGDLCSTDIELGTCHAACLEGCPIVDLNTGNPVDGPIPTYRYDEDMTWAKINDPAALSSVHPVPVVKELEWDLNEARTPFGSTYTFHRTTNNMFVAVGCGSFVGGNHATVEAAKAAAQADFEARIRSALLPTPQPVEGREPVAWRDIPVTDETLDYVSKYGGRCRDCADNFGVCPGGLPCKLDERHAAIRHVLRAINYGMTHGFLATPPLPAQGEPPLTPMSGFLTFIKDMRFTGTWDLPTLDRVIEVGETIAEQNPSPAQGTVEWAEADDWRDDPSADERWNAGLGYGQEQLCAYLGVDPNKVTWDAATETLDGDVQAVIGNIFRAKFGEDFSLASPPVNSDAPRPDPIRNEEFGFVEFINSDVPYVVHELEGRGVAILMSMESRDVIGYRVYDPKAVDGDELKAAAASILDILNTEALVHPTEPSAKRLAERLARAALSSHGSRSDDRLMEREGHISPTDFREAVASLRTALATEREAVQKLRQIIHECAAALPNGAFIAPEATLEFMAHLPEEIRLVAKDLAAKASAAESSLAEATRLLKQNQELLTDLTNGDRAFQERQSSQHLWARCVEAEAESRRFLSQEPSE